MLAADVETERARVAELPEGEEKEAVVVGEAEGEGGPCGGGRRGRSQQQQQIAAATAVSHVRGRRPGSAAASSLCSATCSVMPWPVTSTFREQTRDSREEVAD